MSFVHNVAAPHRVLYMGGQAPIRYTVAPFVHEDSAATALDRIDEQPHPAFAGVITVTEADPRIATLDTVASTQPDDQPWLDLLTDVLRDYETILTRTNEDGHAYDEYIVLRGGPTHPHVTQALSRVCDPPQYSIATFDIFQLVVPDGVSHRGVIRDRKCGIALVYPA